MNITFSKLAWKGYMYWQENDIRVVKKINFLIKEIQCNPYEGSGIPEPLKHQLSGFWSRRIQREHRIVYKIHEDHILIYSLRYHYDK